METHQLVNQLAEVEINTKRIEQLQIKHTPKTKSQRLLGFFLTLLWLGIVCQLASALFSSTGVMYYLSTKLNQNGTLISFCSVALLLCLEGVKRFTLESFHAQRLDDKHVNRITYFFIVLFGGLSTYCGYVGTPYAVQYFAAVPILIDVSQIELEQAKVIEKDTMYWATKKQESQKASAILYAQNHNSKGELRTVAKDLQMKQGNDVKAAQDSINLIFSNNRQMLSILINKAHFDNEKRQKEHLEWCNSFGGSLAWIVAIFELVFFCSFWWCETYSRFEVVEGWAVVTAKAEAEKAAIELLKSQSLGVGNQSVDATAKVAAKDIEEPKDKEKTKAKDIDIQQPTPIGFGVLVAKEGDIIKGEGKKKDRVLVEVAGDLRELTFGQINTLIKGQSEGSPRITHLENLKNLLL